MQIGFTLMSGFGFFFLAAIHIRSTGEYIQINVVITKKPLNGAIIEENVLFGTQK